MDNNATCCDNCHIDLSKCNLDMTLRECLEAHGISPESVQQFLKTYRKK